MVDFLAAFGEIAERLSTEINAMGGFYGSVQVRSTQRPSVVRAAAEAAKRAEIRCLVGPVINGWIGVYPEGAGQDLRVGQWIAADVGGDVLQAAVHDDHLMAYWLWHDGELADEYWSRAGYFHESNRDAQTSMTGDPIAFGDMTQGREKPMLAILHRRRVDLDFEARRLQEFAEFLGVSNAVTSYEYLKAGERAGIERWEDFEEFPSDAVAAEQAAARAKRQVVQQTKDQLRRDWRLLVDVVEEQLIPRACWAGGAMLVAWEGYGRGETRLEVYRQPYGEPEPAEIEVGGAVNGIAADATGARVALALGSRVAVWETQNWQPILELVVTDWATQTTLSADGSLVAYASREGVFVHDVDSGERITALTAHDGPALAFHPSGQWLMIAGSAARFAQVRDTAPWRELYPGGRAPVALELSTAVKREMSHVDIEALEAKWEEQIEAAVAKLTRAGGDADVNARFVASLRQQMARQIEQMRAKLHKLKEGNIPPPREANQNVLCGGFTADGRRLWLGADRGLFVFDWAEVSACAAGSPMPPPLFSYEPLSIDAAGTHASMIHSAAELPAAGVLVFGASSGEILEMNLSDGSVRELAAVPDAGAVTAVIPAPDASAVGVCIRPAFGAHAPPDDDRAIWEVWTYPPAMPSSGGDSALRV